MAVGSGNDTAGPGLVFSRKTGVHYLAHGAYSPGHWQAAVAERSLQLAGAGGTRLFFAPGLLIENNHSEPAAVKCAATPADGFALVVAPTDAQLAPGESQKVEVYVTLPERAPDESVTAGYVTITGHDDVDLTVHVMAQVVMPQPGAVKVRVLDVEVDEAVETEEPREPDESS
jgi:hypothetical protein